MPDPCTLSAARLESERAAWEGRHHALTHRLGAEAEFAEGPLAPWEWCRLREALSFAESELRAINAEIARRAKS